MLEKKNDGWIDYRKYEYPLFCFYKKIFYFSALYIILCKDKISQWPKQFVHKLVIVFYFVNKAGGGGSECYLSLPGGSRHIFDYFTK